MTPFCAISVQFFDCSSRGDPRTAAGSAVAAAAGSAAADGSSAAADSGDWLPSTPASSSESLGVSASAP
jgi:hypothetical protein